MNLSARKAKALFRIMEELSYGYDVDTLRETVGPLFLDLFDSQYFASYVWSDTEQKFHLPVSINMDPDNLAKYEGYFQFCDPITPVLQRRKNATAVSDVLNTRKLQKTEFYNDFLSKDGLHFGVNYYAYASGSNVGDLRIWRSKGKEDFSSRDIELLNAIGPAFTNAIKNAFCENADPLNSKAMLLNSLENVSRQYGLTVREREIAMSVVLGKPDKKIAEELFIEFTTVRTHLKNIFQKLGISSRSELVSRIVMN